MIPVECFLLAGGVVLTGGGAGCLNTQGGVAGGVTSRPVGSIEKDGGERAEQGPGEGGGADDVEESELAAESQVCWEEPGW